jgi:hypothetical protein
VKATKFPEANHTFGKPADAKSSKIATIDAYVGRAMGGSCDGAMICVTQWTPSKADLDALNAGGAVHVTFLGHIVPHFLSTDLETATHPL